MTEDRLTLNEAAQRAGVQPAALRHAIRDERLKAERMESPRGPYWLVAVDEIDRYIAERRPHYTRKGSGDADDGRLRDPE